MTYLKEKKDLQYFRFDVNYNPQIQEAQRSPSRRNIKTTAQSES